MDSNDHASMNIVDGGLLYLNQEGRGVDSNDHAAATRVKGDLLYLNQEGRLQPTTYDLVKK